jgi:oligo-1,6-glucosidase
MSEPWWKQSVVYQIYPRSFCDSNGDGIGDLQGIRSKLDHLVELGIDVVWLSPIYRSPNDDNGYDISDYREIMTEFGTMADFDELLADMHAHGLKLMMDLVVNHCSDEHEWFVDARSSVDSPYRDYFIWRPPAPDGGPPNNWESYFSGSAWEFNEPTGDYYLHFFSKKQPDLNWENPAVRDEIWDLMRFWLDKGVDGFRMDVINMISKVPDLPSVPPTRDGFVQDARHLMVNGPRLIEFLTEMRRTVLDRYDTITVGETPGVDTSWGRALTNDTDGPLDMIFQFEHVDRGGRGGKWTSGALDLIWLKGVMGRWQHDLHGVGWNSLYLSNHDQPRQVSRFGDDGRYRVESAKMLATWLHLHQGTPYVYQGEEIGMTNVAFGSLDEYRDIESLNYARGALERGVPLAEVLRAIHAVGRDNARTPVQWDDSPTGGFTTGTPWIGVNPNVRAVNAVAARADGDSVFHHYRRLIALRRSMPVIVDGSFELVARDHPHVYAFMRHHDGERLLVACNFSGDDQTVDVPGGFDEHRLEPVIGNYPVDAVAAGTGRTLSLRPWEGVAYRTT